MDNTTALVFGYGELGITAVETLVNLGTQVVGLVIPSNRNGLDIELVKSFAAQRGMLLFMQPSRKRSAPFIRQLRKLNPDIILVWSYSMILPPEAIEVPRLGCINLHGGLLPEYRGAHVMQWAIINGENETGATLHYIDEDIDTGPIIADIRFQITQDDNAVSVRQKLKNTGIHLLNDWWMAIISGVAPRISQDESKAKYYRLRTPEDGLIDWSISNTNIYNHIRALVSPWPGAFTFSQEQKIIIWDAKPFEGSTKGLPPGLIRNMEDSTMCVVTGKGDLLIHKVEVNNIIGSPNILRAIGTSIGDLLGGF